MANHAKAIVACDFLAVVTAMFKCLNVFVIIEIGTRKLLYIHVTDHPTATWTQQQLREAIPSNHIYQNLIHDRDRIFFAELDEATRKLGLRVLKRPYKKPLVNCFSEWIIGTLRRACLNFLIHSGQMHVVRTVKVCAS